MSNPLNAQAAPFSPKPTYPDTYPGRRNVGLTPQNTTPGLSTDSAGPTVSTLDSDYVRAIWSDTTVRQDYAKPSAPTLPTDHGPLYRNSGAVAEWLRDSATRPAQRRADDRVTETVVSTIHPSGMTPAESTYALSEVSACNDAFFDGNPSETYVPLVVRKRATADPQNFPLESPNPLPESYPWTHMMRKGSIQERPGERRACANVLVARGPWDAKSISQLAGMFCERAAIESGSIPSVNALFARQVYERFEQVGETPASLFQNQLMQAAFSEFNAYWLPTAPSSLTNVTRFSASPPQASPVHHLSCALAITSYLGDLFTLGLLKGHVIDLCLRMLVDNMVILEHLQAVHALVSHCDEKLLAFVVVQSFVERLEQAAVRISDNASIAGTRFDQGYVQTYMQDIRATLRRWTANPPTIESLTNPVYTTSSQPNRLTRTYHASGPQPSTAEYVSRVIWPFNLAPQATSLDRPLVPRAADPLVVPPLPGWGLDPTQESRGHSVLTLYQLKDWSLDGLGPEPEHI
ncbi:hypothetical protein BXZ70DRAFT_910362 [Cristinia sonorae]|uniref:Uncharacterized protein n=1 Tax=Cristinia sonorae TaxID=1940300 RepID=A0A8K0UFM5_9AGAR|nr:hypothetical protein BXZ70DRAFT_910362 [Cristinia sonorae]